MSEAESRPVAVVIGVGPRLGASLARRFAAKYAVAINARKTDYLRTLASDIRGHGGEVLEVQADIGKASTCGSPSSARICAKAFRTSLRRDAFYRRHGRRQAGGLVGRVQSGKFCQARTSSVASPRPRPERQTYSLDQYRWRESICQTGKYQI